MANAIRYSTTGDTQSLKKGNFFFGVGDVGKGPSSATTYYNGSTPVASGYTIYSYDVTQTSRISYASPTSDSEFIGITNVKSGQNFTGVTQCLNWYVTQTDHVSVNKDYEPIVSNGLVLNLDASYTPSYTSSGSTWYDLAYSGNNGTLTNGPTYSSTNGGNIVLDGIDDYVSSSYYTNTNFTNNQSWTIDVLLNVVSNITSGNGRGGILANQKFSSESNPGGFGLNILNGTYCINLTSGTTGNAVSYQNLVSIPIKYNLDDRITAVYDSQTSTVKMYRNGVLSGTSTDLNYGWTPRSVGGGQVIGTSSQNGWGYYFPMKLYNVLMYNKALSNQEVLQNYQSQLPKTLGNNIVTQGLIVYLDAGYSQSYPTTGTTWFNVSGVSGGTGTLTNGPTYSSTNGGSILFDGIDDYVVTPSFSLSSATSCLTFNFWVKPSGQTSVVQTILGKDTNTGNVPHILIGRSANSDALRWNFNNGTGSAILAFLNFFTGYDNTWVNIQIVADYSLDIVTLYRNGTQFGQQSQPSAVFPNTDTIMYLSSFAINAFLLFKGNISISQIYNRALSATEVLQNYNAQKSRFGL